MAEGTYIRRVEHTPSCALDDVTFAIQYVIIGRGHYVTLMRSKWILQCSVPQTAHTDMHTYKCVSAHACAHNYTLREYATYYGAKTLSTRVDREAAVLQDVADLQEHCQPERQN